MTGKNFDNVVSKQINACVNTLLKKEKEYAPETAYEDRLLHFKKAAAVMGVTPKAALLGMLSKHIVSVSDMCMSDKDYSMSRWDEKITDSINYLLILRAIVEEEKNE